MNKDTLKTLLHAVKWAEERKTPCEVEFKLKLDIANAPPKYNICVTDKATWTSSDLPIPFTSSIDKYLCLKNQESLRGSLEYSQQKLTESIKLCEDLLEQIKMKYFVQFLNKGPFDTTVEALGTDGVCILDGRCGLDTMINDAHKQLRRLNKNIHNYTGWRIMKGDRFDSAVVAREYLAPKGKLNGICNITRCQETKDIVWFNQSTEKYYCPECAKAINSENAVRSLKLYGTSLCVRRK